MASVEFGTKPKGHQAFSPFQMSIRIVRICQVVFVFIDLKHQYEVRDEERQRYWYTTVSFHVNVIKIIKCSN